MTDVRVVPSLLDRLTVQDDAFGKAQTVRGLKESVVRDLESLLNTRNTYDGLPSAVVEAGRSVLTYGVPDFSALNISSELDRETLCAALQRAITSFEPRLTDVSAVLLTAPGTERSICVRVEGRLRLDPDIELVSFDIVMPVNTYKCEIKDAG